MIAAMLDWSMAHGQDGAVRAGRVELSNGEVLEGLISTTPGASLRLQVGDDLKDVPLEAVQEMRFVPVHESMEQKWRFVEAGRNEKKKWGVPYPVRELQTQMILGSGRVFTGHLYTTVLYVAQSNETVKVVIKAKDKGTEGQTFKDVVCPVRISLSGKAVALPGDIHIDAGQAKDVEFVTLAQGSMVRLATRAENGGLVLPALSTPAVFAAVHNGGEYRVGWPAQSDPALTEKIEKTLADVNDFFDSYKILGSWQDGDEIYSLQMMHRKGPTSLPGEKSQPWRLEIWRWKEQEGKRMLAGRGYFFRGILNKTSEPPPVKLDPALWKLELKDRMKLP
ncbi:MAG: hypothetical protein ACOYOU_01625 [Kiritimatiellia bacterium]